MQPQSETGCGAWLTNQTDHSNREHERSVLSSKLTIASETSLIRPSIIRLCGFHLIAGWRLPLFRAPADAPSPCSNQLESLFLSHTVGRRYEHDIYAGRLQDGAFSIVDTLVINSTSNAGLKSATHTRAAAS
jgi:hypothetical protein